MSCKKKYCKPSIIKMDSAFALIEPFSRSWCYASSSK